jgi:hypothetical protein
MVRAWESKPVCCRQMGIVSDSSHIALVTVLCLPSNEKTSQQTQTRTILTPWSYLGREYTFELAASRKSADVWSKRLQCFFFVFFFLIAKKVQNTRMLGWTSPGEP